MENFKIQLEIAIKEAAEAKRQVGELRKELDGMKKASDEAGTAGKKLGDNARKVGADAKATGRDMAGLIDILDNSTQQFGSLGGMVGQASNQFGQFSTVSKSLAGALGPVGIGIAALTAALPLLIAHLETASERTKTLAERNQEITEAARTQLSALDDQIRQSNDRNRALAVAVGAYADLEEALADVRRVEEDLSETNDELTRTQTALETAQRRQAIAMEAGRGNTANFAGEISRLRDKEDELNNTLAEQRLELDRVTRNANQYRESLERLEAPLSALGQAPGFAGALPSVGGDLGGLSPEAQERFQREQERRRREAEANARDAERQAREAEQRRASIQALTQPGFGQNDESAFLASQGSLVLSEFGQMGEMQRIEEEEHQERIRRLEELDSREEELNAARDRNHQDQLRRAAEEQAIQQQAIATTAMAGEFLLEQFGATAGQMELWKGLIQTAEAIGAYPDVFGMAQHGISAAMHFANAARLGVSGGGSKPPVPTGPQAQPSPPSGGSSDGPREITIVVQGNPLITEADIGERVLRSIDAAHRAR